MENTTTKERIYFAELGPKQMAAELGEPRYILQAQEQAPLDERQSGQQTKLPRQLTHDLSKLSSRRRKHIWTYQQNNRMLQLHHQLGNKWSTISKQLTGKSDNDIKNHFFSQLRMALRNLNKLLAKPNLKKQQTVKPTILIKVTNYCEEQFNPQSQIPKELIESAVKIKKSLFNFLYEDENHRMEQFTQLMKEIKFFNSKTSKDKKKKRQEEVIAFLCEDQSVCLQQEGNALESSNIFDVIKCDEHSQLNIYPCHIQLEKGSEEVKPDLTKPEDTSELIARPSFCLDNPFEQAQIEIEEGGWYEQIHQPQQSNFSRYLYPFEFKSFEL